MIAPDRVPRNLAYLFEYPMLLAGKGAAGLDKAAKAVKNTGFKWRMLAGVTDYDEAKMMLVRRRAIVPAHRAHAGRRLIFIIGTIAQLLRFKRGGPRRCTSCSNVYEL